MLLLAGLLKGSYPLHTWYPATAPQSLLEAVVKAQVHYHHPTYAQAEADQAYAVCRSAFPAQTTPFWALLITRPSDKTIPDISLWGDI